MKLYEMFIKSKEAGRSLNFENLTKEELKTLFIDESVSDARIASLFEVKPSRVTYLRRKYGITIKNSLIDQFLSPQSDIAEKYNKEMKGVTLTKENINKISKALTHFAFRNGPIEDMHADPEKNITDDDMMKLNKYMVNRMAYVFTLIIEEKWGELNFLVEQMDLMFGEEWDSAVPDDGGNNEQFIKFIEQLTN